MSSGFLAAANFSFTFSTRSSSTQPPDTGPTIWPSSRIATMAPTGRGAEPQVLTIVPSAARWPCLRQASAVRSTSISTLSMRKCYRNSAALLPYCIRNGNARAMSRGDLAQEGVALDRRPVELEAEIDIARQRLVHPRVGFAFCQHLQIELGGVGARAGLGAREREQLVGKARGANRRFVHLLELRAHFARQGL